MTTPRELQALYDQGANISAHLRQEKGLETNSTEIIEIAYDLQTGSYIAAMQDAATAKLQEAYSAELARTILSLCKPISILEAGVGEASTLAGVLSHLEVPASYGFDLSWSRVAFARYWLEQHKVKSTTLCTGNLCNIPFADNSIDVVYTSHSIEPNGGKEEAILRELYRVTRQFLLLLEPGYELADGDAQRRMDSHGYCRNLQGTALSLGFEVLEHKLFPFTPNPLNPTAMTVIRKCSDATVPSHVLACPKSKAGLRELGGMLFSPEALVVYPVLAGIPCLRIENGVFASKYQEVMQARYQAYSRARKQGGA